jgi:hypothetical protein
VAYLDTVTSNGGFHRGGYQCSGKSVGCSQVGCKVGNEVSELEAETGMLVLDEEVVPSVVTDVMRMGRVCSFKVGEGQ